MIQKFERSEINSIIQTMKVNNMELSRFKTSFIERRFKARMNELKISNLEEYLQLLNKGSNESTILIKSLSINVTHFFRDKHVFDAFASKIIPQIHKAKNGKVIKVWSAACASGEEAYSLAIMFNEALNNKDTDFKVYATDISSNAIEFAKKGIYTLQQLKNLQPHMISKYFYLDDEQYIIKNELKNKVHFSVGDIVSSSLKYMDSIFCRNVLIYYEKDAQELFFKKFYHVLNTNGYLVLGMDESLMGNKCANLYEFIDLRERIYKKILSV